MIDSTQLTATHQVIVRMPKARPGWITFQDAAARLGVSRSTFWRWYDADRQELKTRVRFVKMGRERYVNEADLESWDAWRFGEDAPPSPQEGSGGVI